MNYHEQLRYLQQQLSDIDKQLRALQRLDINPPPGGTYGALASANTWAGVNTFTALVAFANAAFSITRTNPASTNTYLYVETLNTDPVAQFWQDSADALGPILVLGKSRGTVKQQNTVVQNGDALGSLIWYGADGASNTTPTQAAAIVVEVDGTPGNSDMPGRLKIQVTPDGGNVPVTAVTISQNKDATFAGSIQSPTIVTPTIASFTNATHSHLNAAGGGAITDLAALAPGSDLAGVIGGSGAVTFPAGIKVVSSASLLNVLTEGTWTPAITGSGGNPTVTYTTQTGTYLKINTCVICSASIVINTISGGSGNMRVSLPVAAGSDQHTLSAYMAGVDLPGTPVSLACITTASAATASFIVVQDNAGGSQVQISGLAAGDTIFYSGIYFT